MKFENEEVSKADLGRETCKARAVKFLLNTPNEVRVQRGRAPQPKARSGEVEFEMPFM